MILDPTAVMEIYKGKATKLPESVAMPSVAKYLVLRAIAAIKRKRGFLIERERQLYEFLDKCPTIELNEDIAFSAAELSAILSEKNIFANSAEILIAATALENSKPLLTANKIYLKIQKAEKKLEVIFLH